MYTKTSNGKRIPAIIIASTLMLMALFISGAPQASAATQNVTFAATYSGVSGSFSAGIEYVDATVSPGGTVEIDFTANQGPASLTLNLGIYGGSYTLDTDTPLGTVHIPLTGTVGADIGVDLTGRLDGDLNVSGPGTVDTASISWSSWDAKTVTVDASNAEAGDTIYVELELEYVITVGASAVISIFGFTSTIDILDVDLGSISGSQTVQVQIDVESAGLDIMILLILLIIIIVVVVVAVLALMMKKKTPTQQQQQQQPYDQQPPPPPSQYPPQDQYGQYQQPPPPPQGQ